MRMPTVYTAREIHQWHIEEEYEPNKWRPARCCAYFGLRLRTRLRMCWLVFTGKCDVLSWGNTSGEWNNPQVNYRDIKHREFGQPT